MTGMAQRTLMSGVVALVLVAAACASGEEKGPNGELKLHGTVHMVQTDSGGTCWKFESSKGNAYELQQGQAPHDLLVDGASAVLLVKPRVGGSYCKVGQLVDVVKADSIAGGTAAAAPPTTTS